MALANVVVREESDDQRLNRLYNEAMSCVQSALSPVLTTAMEQAGTRADQAPESLT
jgi:hypothetical protein